METNSLYYHSGGMFVLCRYWFFGLALISAVRQLGSYITFIHWHSGTIITVPADKYYAPVIHHIIYLYQLDFAIVTPLSASSSFSFSKYFHLLHHDFPVSSWKALSSFTYNCFPLVHEHSFLHNSKPLRHPQERQACSQKLMLYCTACNL